MDVLSALDVLLNAPKSSLQPHTAKAILTLKKVGEHLQTDILPSALSHEIEVNSLNVSTDNTPINPPPDKPTEAQVSQRRRENQLHLLVKGSLKWTISLWPLREHSANDIIPRKRSPGQDQRLEDIARIEGNREATVEEHLVRVFAVRELALDFVKDQDNKEGEKTVSRLCRLIESFYTDTNANANVFRQWGVLTDYVNNKPQFRSKELAKRSIGSGIKHLVCEELLKRRLGDVGLLCSDGAGSLNTSSSDARSETENWGIVLVSVVLGLNIKYFKSLHFEDIPMVLDCMLSPGTTIPKKDPMIKDRHILDVLRDLAPFIRESVKFYKVARDSDPWSESSPRNSKRVRLATRVAEDQQDVPVSPLTSVDTEGSEGSVPETPLTAVSHTSCSERDCSSNDVPTALNDFSTSEPHQLEYSSVQEPATNILPWPPSAFGEGLFSQVITQPHYWNNGGLFEQLPMDTFWANMATQMPP